MTPHMPKHSAGPPASAGVLTRYARAYAQQAGVSEGRVRTWVAYMIMSGILERSATEVDGHRFTVKGGVALELRFGDRARATKDIDLVLHDDHVDMARALERALSAESDQGFAFRRKGEPKRLDNGAINLEFGVTYRGGAWTNVVVDVARAEPGEWEVERVPGIPLFDAFGVHGPVDLPCLTLRMHIAQKLHGMTLPPRSGKRNERFRDLVDLLILEPLVTDYVALLDACTMVFQTRATHPWPPTLVAPVHWVEPFTRLAKELALPIQDALMAIEHIREFIDRIVASAVPPSTTIDKA